MSNAYVYGMFARALTMLAMLAIAVVTTIGAAHAARMPAAMQPGQTMHVGMMAQPDDQNSPSCLGDQGCGMEDAGACVALCAGLQAYTPAPFNAPDRADPPILHATTIVTIPAGGAPGLNEQPPRTRLL